MAKRDAQGTPKSWSSKLDKLAFMRRAVQKSKLIDDVKERAFKNEEDHWTLQPSNQSGGCAVIIEGDPPHGAPTGRMSFQNFNPVTEKLQMELDSQHQRLQYIRELGEQLRKDKDNGAEISAEDMAKRLKSVDLVLNPALADEGEGSDVPGRLSGLKGEEAPVAALRRHTNRSGKGRKRARGLPLSGLSHQSSLGKRHHQRGKGKGGEGKGEGDGWNVPVR